MTDDITFTPAQAGRASEDVALQLEAAIISGKVKPGDHLPSERELQSLFQTGRGVIREALKVLRQKGMIEVRKGSKGGTYIKQIDVANVSESLALFLQQNQIDSEHVVTFRESMDRTIAMLATVQATAEEKQALVQGANELVELAHSDEPDLLMLGDKDRELNIQFAQMSKNPVFEWVMRAMQMGFSSQDYALYEDKEFRQKTAKNWQLTASALAEGDVFKCTAYIGTHYLLLRECVDAAKQHVPDVAELIQAIEEE